MPCLLSQPGSSRRKKEKERTWQVKSDSKHTFRDTQTISAVKTGRKVRCAATSSARVS